MCVFPQDRSWRTVFSLSYYIAVLLIFVCSRNRVAPCWTVTCCTVLYAPSLRIRHCDTAHFHTTFSRTFRSRCQKIRSLLLLLIPVLDSILIFFVHAYRICFFNFVLILFPANHAPHPRRQTLMDALCYTITCNKSDSCLYFCVNRPRKNCTTITRKPS